MKTTQLYPSKGGVQFICGLEIFVSHPASLTKASQIWWGKCLCVGKSSEHSHSSLGLWVFAHRGHTSGRSCLGCKPCMLPY